MTITIEYADSEWTPGAPWVVKSDIGGHITSFATFEEAQDYAFEIVAFCDSANYRSGV